MTYTEQDIHDDASFCIGDEKEGFYASESVCDSDISLTDGESDYDEDESICTDDECDDISVDGSLTDIENMADSDRDMPDEISFRCGGCATDHADRSRNNEMHDDYECTKKSSDESIDTELTMACSEMDGFEDAYSFYRNQYQEFCPQEYVPRRAVNVIDDEEEIEIVIEASNIMASSNPEPEEYGFISRETLEKVLYNPVQLAASLTILAHLTVRDSKSLKSHARCEFEDEMPMIVV